MEEATGTQYKPKLHKNYELCIKMMRALHFVYYQFNIVDRKSGAQEHKFHQLPLCFWKAYKTEEHFSTVVEKKKGSVEVFRHLLPDNSL